MDSPIKYLIQGIFQKVEEELEDNATVNACCTTLESKFRDDFNCFEGTSSRSFERLYKKYVEGSQPGNATPRGELLNVMSQYLGYTSYQDYIVSHGKGSTKNSAIPSNNKWYKLKKPEHIIILILTLITCAVLGYTILNGSGQSAPECMVWNQTHFERISCELSLNFEKAGKIMEYDKTLFSKMEMIPGSEVEVGRSYYYKIGRDSIQFFSWDGKHPVNGGNLKPVTPYIVEKYIQH